MAQVAKRGTAFMLSFSAAEAKELGTKPDAFYELSKARDGIWVLVEGAGVGAGKGAAEKNVGRETAPGEGKAAEEKNLWQSDGHMRAEQTDDVKQKIIGLLRKAPPRDRMEGWFEKKLSPEERKKFAEMLARGEVVRFKSSEVFRKALYTLPKKIVKPTQTPRKFENTEKPFQDFTLEKDGFLVVKNEERAKALSEELMDSIKAGEIKGTRAFTGEFFIIYTDLLEGTEAKVLDEIKKSKSARLSELVEKLVLTPTLARIALEFLKEEGQVIEKRKDFYQYIE